MQYTLNDGQGSFKNWNAKNKEFRGIVLGFQPTYKELKRKNSIKQRRHSTCFQPTYKELKHHLFAIVFKVYPVSSLPIRN